MRKAYLVIRLSEAVRGTGHERDPDPNSGGARTDESERVGGRPFRPLGGERVREKAIPDPPIDLQGCKPAFSAKRF